MAVSTYGKVWYQKNPCIASICIIVNELVWLANLLKECFDFLLLIKALLHMLLETTSNNRWINFRSMVICETSFENVMVVKVF